MEGKLTTAPKHAQVIETDLGHEVDERVGLDQCGIEVAMEFGRGVCLGQRICWGHKSAKQEGSGREVG